MIYVIYAPTCTEGRPPGVHHSVTYHYVLPRRGDLLVIFTFRLWLRRVRDVTRSFPASRRRGSIHYIFQAFSVAETPFGLFRTEYKLICSFNTFCTCIRPYYVQKTYKTTYEFHFQLGFSRRVQAVTSLRSSLASRRPGDRS